MAAGALGSSAAAAAAHLAFRRFPRRNLGQQAGDGWRAAFLQRSQLQRLLRQGVKQTLASAGRRCACFKQEHRAVRLLYVSASAGVRVHVLNSGTGFGFGFGFLCALVFALVLDLDLFFVNVSVPSRHVDTPAPGHRLHVDSNRIMT
ncbi:hypothetical protein [Paenibacillus fonticola]|uniref:hypothetical protein n=1 Tax=Paenibacillus fonticola TaxID=379896 RepID=UPI0012FA8A7D|nr:hypothetical protein [Paenibacillus fonticola]